MRVLRMRASLRHVGHSMFRSIIRRLYRTKASLCISSRHGRAGSEIKSEFTNVSLEQINATTKPSKGSIIFDFGGPGNINVDNFAGSNGEALLL